jgi:hypothetical protein
MSEKGEPGGYTGYQHISCPLYFNSYVYAENFLLVNEVGAAGGRKGILSACLVSIFADWKQKDRLLHVIYTSLLT